MEEELVTSSVVEAVVEASCAVDARPVSWKLAHFTTSFCVLRSLKVKIMENGKEYEKCYIVKQSRGNPGDPFQVYRSRAFLKEAFFYQRLVPLLNTFLETTGGAALKVPSCYFAHSSQDNAVMVMQDLRSSGFQTSNKWIMDEQHSLLVVREVARLHAASTLLQKQEKWGAFEEVFPLLQESWTISEEHRAPFQGVVETGTTLMANSFCDAPHLKELQQWLLKVAPVALKLIMGQLEKHASSMRVITHGDLHSRNVLFKYDAAGSPVDVMMVDLQVTRFCSLAVDIGYFSHFSVLSQHRIQTLPGLLDGYYESFLSVLSNNNSSNTVSPPFTRQQLEQEVTDNKTGLFEAILLLPIAVTANNAADCWSEQENNTQDKDQNKDGVNKNPSEEEEENNDTINDERREEIISVLQQLAQYANDEKIHQQFADIDKFIWKG